VLKAEGVTPDFAQDGPDPLNYLHRTLPDADIWFVANPHDKPMAVRGRFRVVGREAEIWRADTGSIAPSSYAIQERETEVPLSLAPFDAVFVVFKGRAALSARRVREPILKEAVVVDGPWTISFQKNRGAPDEARMGALTSWTESALPGIRYFSGMATYATGFQLPSPTAATYTLDLGAVGDIARVRINGCDAGIAWKPPYRLQIRNCLRGGLNRLEVDVANVWMNRLIGDAQPDAGTAIASTTFPFANVPGVGLLSGPAYTATSALHPSGLMGPVKLLFNVE
jgi:hypothetical protein